MVEKGESYMKSGVSNNQFTLFDNSYECCAITVKQVVVVRHGDPALISHNQSPMTLAAAIILILVGRSWSRPVTLSHLNVTAVSDFRLKIECRLTPTLNDPFYWRFLMFYVSKGTTFFQTVRYPQEPTVNAHSLTTSLTTGDLTPGNQYLVRVVTINAAKQFSSNTVAMNFTLPPLKLLNFTVSMDKYYSQNYTETITFSFTIPPWSDYKGFTVECRATNLNDTLIVRQNFEDPISVAEKNVARGQQVYLSNTPLNTGPIADPENRPTDGIYRPKPDVLSYTRAEYRKWIKVIFSRQENINRAKIFYTQEICGSTSNRFMCYEKIMYNDVLCSPTYNEGVPWSHPDYQLVRYSMAPFGVVADVHFNVAVGTRILAVASITDSYIWPLEIMEIEAYHPAESTFRQLVVSVSRGQIPNGAEIDCSIYYEGTVGSNPARLQRKLLRAPIGPKVKVMNLSQLENGRASIDVTFEKIYQTDTFSSLQLKLNPSSNTTSIVRNNTSVTTVSNLQHGGLYSLHYTAVSTLDGDSKYADGPTYELRLPPLKPKNIQFNKTDEGHLSVLVMLESDTITVCHEVNLYSPDIDAEYTHQSTQSVEFVYTNNLVHGKTYQFLSWCTVTLGDDNLDSESNTTRTYYTKPATPTNFTVRNHGNNSWLFRWEVIDHRYQDGFLLLICSNSTCLDVIDIPHTNTNTVIEYELNEEFSSEFNASLRATRMNMESSVVYAKFIQRQYTIQQRDPDNDVHPLLVFSGVSLVTLILGIAGGFGFSRNRSNQVNSGAVQLQLVPQMADRGQLQSNFIAHTKASRRSTTATSELMRMNTGRKSTIKSRSRYRSRRYTVRK